ncbi:MAG: DUF3488 and transglutaminase-like domain-containing protein [Lachnospiraceae bacterium]|nr:DUF3488 and transglutaminase-like domain-containing protein [Lachnospiraceae bacterium]
MIKKMLYDTLYILPVVMAMLLWYLSDKGSAAVYVRAGLISAVVTAAGIFLIHLKAEGKIILSGILISSVMAVFFICPAEIRERLLIEHVDILICICIAMLVFVPVKLLISFSAGRIILGAAMISLLIAALTMGISPDKLIVVLMLGIVFCVVADEIQIRWKKTGDTGHKDHLVSVSPFILLFAISIMFMPGSDKPYDWGFVKRIAASAAEQIDRIERKFAKGSGRGYGDAFVGFSEEPGFGAELKPNSRLVLEAEFGAHVPFAVYLYGKSFDCFTGREWAKTYTEENADREMDALELAYGVSLDPDADPNEYYRTGDLKVRLQDDAPEYFFAPDKIIKLTADDKTLAINEAGGDLHFDRTGEDVSYSVRYYYINNNSPAFISLASDAPDDDEALWDAVTEQYGVSGNDAYSYENYMAYRERMESVYLPETKVSERMEHLLDELMTDADSDMEKLKRIEGFLSSMEYSMNPGAMPPEIDTTEEFLDHLIFEKKAGYCVYYATAFVLLARYEGIPARYVQGFMVIPEKFSSAEVTGNAAHAWPECYIRGIGWVAFEPTPGYKVGRYWQTADDTDIAETESVSYNFTVSEDTVSADSADESSGNGAAENRGLWFYIAVIAAISVIVTSFLMFIILMTRRLQYLLMNDEKKFVTMFGRNMRLLQILGLDIEAGETLEGFMRRSETVMLPELFGFIPVYEEYLYKGTVPGKEQVECMQKSNEELRTYVKTLGLRKRLKLIWTMF